LHNRRARIRRLVDFQRIALKTSLSQEDGVRLCIIQRPRPGCDPGAGALNRISPSKTASRFERARRRLKSP